MYVRSFNNYVKPGVQSEYTYIYVHIFITVCTVYLERPIITTQYTMCLNKTRIVTRINVNLPFEPSKNLYNIFWEKNTLFYFVTAMNEYCYNNFSLITFELSNIHAKRLTVI